MHGPRCIPARAVAETIVLPRRGEARAFAAGASVSLGIELRPAFGLCLTLLDDATIELTVSGGASTVVVLPRGFRRVVSPEHHANVLITCNAGGSFWIEDLAALRSAEGYE